MAFCSVSVSAQKKSNKLVWLPGTIVLTQYETGVNTLTVKEGDVNPNAADYEKDKTRDIAMRDDYETIKVQTAEGTYNIARSHFFIWQKRLKLSDGEGVQIAVKDDFVYVKTSKGKKAKYHLVQIEPNQK
jgi:hypothetical protein